MDFFWRRLRRQVGCAQYRQPLVVYHQLAGKSAGPTTGDTVSLAPLVRGCCQESAPGGRPGRDPGPLVALCQAARRLAQPRRDVLAAARHPRAPTRRGAAPHAPVGGRCPRGAPADRAASTVTRSAAADQAPPARAILRSIGVPPAGGDDPGGRGVGPLRAPGQPRGGLGRPLSWGACPGDVLETPGPRGPGPRLVGALRGRGLACVAEGLGLRAPARGGEVEPPPVRLGLGEAAEPRKALTRSVLCAVPGQPWPRDAW